MATGMSIHVGVNDTKAPGITAPLQGCDQDAADMRELAHNRGFIGVNGGEPDLLLKDEATREAVLAKMLLAAEKLQEGDTFLFTFSGHGARRGQEDHDEVDELDEMLVMQDLCLVDNVLRKLVWPSFNAGVRVVMVADSCHSGGAAMSIGLNSVSESSREELSVATALGGRDWSAAAVSPTRDVKGRPQSQFRIRTISESEGQNHFGLMKEIYDKLRSNLPQDPPPIKADVLLLAACREHETTKDGDPNGVFTGELIKVFKSDTTKTYQQLMDAVRVNLQLAGEPSHPVLKPITNTPTFSGTEAFRI